MSQHFVLLLVFILNGTTIENTSEASLTLPDFNIFVYAAVIASMYTVQYLFFGFLLTPLMLFQFKFNMGCQE